VLQTVVRRRMRLKQKPEDFSVKESFRYDPVPTGTFRVYLMDKQKLSTFDAVDRIRLRFGLKIGAISYCGLKDKQGRTEQLIAVEGHDVDMQDDDLRLKFLGRTDAPLSARNTTSNRFAITVRQVTQPELSSLAASAVEMRRLGVVNYFDSQRFGSLKHGQGFIAKDLLRGDFEAALKNHFAKPSPLDQSEDAYVKAFWRTNWGQWTKKCPYPGNKKYFRILNSLRDEPKDFVKAFLQIDSSYRALLIFTYQSFLWNECARRLLQICLPRTSIFPMPYQAGTLLFHRDAPAEMLEFFHKANVPLLAPDTVYTSAQIEEACNWVLGREKLQLSQLVIKESPKMLFFKHEERPLLVHPDKLVIAQPARDEMNRGFSKVNVAFTLPPGSYATLVTKRLFHFGVSKTDLEMRGPYFQKPVEVDPKPLPNTREIPVLVGKPAQAPAAASRTSVRHNSVALQPTPPEKPAAAALSFRAAQRAKKQQRKANQLAAKQPKLLKKSASKSKVAKTANR
jgi:tRNA pseudouridine13 synthase